MYNVLISTLSNGSVSYEKVSFTSYAEALNHKNELIADYRKEKSRVCKGFAIVNE